MRDVHEIMLDEWRARGSNYSGSGRELARTTSGCYVHGVWISPALIKQLMDLAYEEGYQRGGVSG